MLNLSIQLLLGLSSVVNAVQFTHDVSFKEFAEGEPQPAVPHRYNPATHELVKLPEVDQKGFWFGKFKVGAAKKYQMLIDTGSSDVYINPGKYRKSSQSKNLHRNFSITFATVNPNGSGTTTLTGPLYRDIVASHGLKVSNQEVGVVQSPKKPQIPQDGLIGFASRFSSAFGGRPWIHSLCAQNKLNECRFGLAYNTDKTGTQTIGGVDHSKFKGKLTTAPTRGEWVLLGDIAVNNKIISKNINIITDSGTTVVYAPLAQARTIFRKLGLQTSFHRGSTSYLRAFFPCDKPPKVGFEFPASKDRSPSSDKGKIFNINGKAFAFKDDGNNNCTSTLQGMDPDFGGWLVGQSFFQTHYVDHNIHDGTMGFADLS